MSKIILNIFMTLLLLMFLLPFITRFIYGSPTVKYTIGTTTGFHLAGTGSSLLYYDYSVLNKKYSDIVGTGFNNVKTRKSILNKRYYMEFNIKYPASSYLFTGYMVPDSIKSAPPEGWDSIPYVGRLEQPILRYVDSAPPVIK